MSMVTRGIPSARTFSHRQKRRTGRPHKLSPPRTTVDLATTATLRNPTVWATEDPQQSLPMFTSIDGAEWRLRHYAFPKARDATPPPVGALKPPSSESLSYQASSKRQEVVTAPSHAPTLAQMHYKHKKSKETDTTKRTQWFSSNWPQRKGDLWLMWKRIQNNYFKEVQRDSRKHR